MRQRPRAIFADIADEAEFPFSLEDARHGCDGSILYEAPLPVPPFRPWVGMDQIDPGQRLLGRPRQQFAGIAREQPDIADVMGLDLRQDLRHAVDVRLAADEAGIWKGTGFGDQMLAAPKSDFEPDGIEARVEQSGKIGRLRAINSQRKPRQQMFEIRSAW